MAFVVRPATAERFDDVATILAPKREGAQGCWCLPYRLTPREDEALRAPARALTVEALCGRDHAPGVLAHEGEEVVGWAAIAPRS